MKERVPVHKGVYILPNLFTSASLFAAFFSLILAADGKFEHASIAILMSAILDGLDGRVARLTGTESEFGVQFDSLADLVAFGVAPAFMIYQLALYPYKRLGIVVAFLFAACCALRLARFNVTAGTPGSSRFFTGLPAPAGGCALASFVLFVPKLAVTVEPEFAYIPQYIIDNISPISLVLTLLVGLLMVSQIRYAAFKEMGFVKAHPFRYTVFAIVLFAVVAIHPKSAIFVLLYGYILSGLIYTFLILPRNKSLAHRKAGRAKKKEQDAKEQELHHMDNEDLSEKDIQ